MVRTMTDWPLRLLVTLILVWIIGGEFLRTLPGDLLWDFGSFVASGRAAAQGLDPYGIHELTFHVSIAGFDMWNPNLNPPISALLFQLFDGGDVHQTFRIWRMISIAIYVATVLLLFDRYGATPLTVLWVFALAGFWDTLLLGQIYIPLVFMAVAAWLLLERRQHIAAGILIGLVVSMKPNVLVWPVLLFLAGHRPAPIAAAITAAVVSAVPLLVYGPDIYGQWLSLVAGDGSRAVFLTNASIAGFAARAGIPWAGLPLSLALLLGLALWAVRRRPGIERASGFALLAALLASPLGWVHYTLFLLPLLLSRWHHPEIRLAGLMLCVPVPMVLARMGAPALDQLTLGSVYGWALLICVGSLVADRWRQAVPSAQAGRISGRPGSAADPAMPATTATATEPVARPASTTGA